MLLSLKSIVCKRSIGCIILLRFRVSQLVRVLVLTLILMTCSWAQPPSHESKHKRGPGKEIGSGAANIGTGAAKGAGNLAKGTGKGAVDLVTLHPINAAGSVGRGAGAAGKDVTKGTVKGTAKIGHGIGRAIKKIF